MRRALLDELPAFCHFYGLKPWDVARMTAYEIDEFRIQYQRYLVEQEG